MSGTHTEQQSLDVRDGHARRVGSGLFVGLAPYGYANVRRDGRGLFEVHPEHGRKVRRLFDLYAYHGHTVDSLRDQLAREGIVYTDACPQFPRSKLYSILKDRAYLGEVMYLGNWYSVHQSDPWTKLVRDVVSADQLQPSELLLPSRDDADWPHDLTWGSYSGPGPDRSQEISGRVASRWCSRPIDLDPCFVTVASIPLWRYRPDWWGIRRCSRRPA